MLRPISRPSLAGIISAAMVLVLISIQQAPSVEAAKSLGFPKVIKCANITKKSDIKYPSYDVHSQEYLRPRNELYMAIANVMARFGVPFQLQWGQLLGWYRDCEWNWRDHDIDIAMFASDWTPQLQHALLRAWQTHRCTNGHASTRWAKHRTYKFQTPMQTLFHCKGHSKGWVYFDVAYIHRRSAAGAEPAVNQHGHVLKSDPKNVWWWITSNAQHHHFRYSPYSLVPADIFGMPGWAPDNIEQHLEEFFGPGWVSIDPKATKTKMVNEIGRDPVLKQVSYDEEWWAEVPGPEGKSRLVRATVLGWQDIQDASTNGYPNKVSALMKEMDGAAP